MWGKSFYFKIPIHLNFLTPKVLALCDLILVTLIKMQTDNSHFSREIRPHPAAHPH